MGAGLGGGCIRLYHPGEFVGSTMEFCPITAVAYDRTGAYHDLLNWRDAAGEIGLDHETGKVIAEAADHEAPWPINPNVRDKIKAACGLAT